MIVRNEAHILKRCLESVIPYVDHWVISDTGSIDNTCVVARATMHDLPGKVIHNPWVDFGRNRTIALQAAKESGCEFALVIDADEVLVVEDARVLLDLDGDAYRVEMRFPGMNYPRLNIMRLERDFRYVGVIHEYAEASPPADEWLLDPTKIHMWTDGQGARGKRGDKSKRDCQTLVEAVRNEPENARYWFYLAQAYETVGLIDLAIYAYEHRIPMTGYAAEVFYSHYRSGLLRLGQNNWPEAQRHLLAAYGHSPHRAESLYALAVAHHNRLEDNVALVYLEAATMLDQPVSDLFVEPDVYHHLSHMQYAVCLYNVGRRDEAHDLALDLLSDGRVPDASRGVMLAIAGQPMREAVSVG
jgi:glycosyltransferase involved in cell wall biosynthesis